MKTAMKIVIVACALSVTGVSAQRKYYIEQNGTLNPTTQAYFEKSIDYNKNVDVYLENDTSEIAVLYVRRREGKLDSEKMNLLRKYLKQISGGAVIENHLIIINYITSVPVIEPKEPISNWYILNKNYTTRLKKETPNYYFIYNEAQTEAKNHYNRKYIKLYPDTGSNLLKLLFPAEANYGNAAVIRPDGTFITYLGEYGPDEVYRMIESFKKTH